MPLPVIIDCYRVAMNWTGPSGETAENVIHVANATGWPNAAPAILSDLSDAFNAGRASGSVFMHSSVSDDAILQDMTITPLDGATASTNGGGPYGGGGSGAVVPQVAPVITLYTLERGRRARGRIYMPFTRETAIDAGFLDSGVKDKLQAGWTAFRTSLGPGAMGTDFVVASYADAEFRTIDHCKVQSVLGTQRRRQSRLRS